MRSDAHPAGRMRGAMKTMLANETSRARNAIDAAVRLAVNGARAGGRSGG